MLAELYQLRTEATVTVEDKIMFMVLTLLEYQDRTATVKCMFCLRSKSPSTINEKTS